MARPRSIDDAVILDAAREVFLERGFSATTAEVAARAGISEGSIFNRFGSKRRLFQQAMAIQVEQEPWLRDLPSRVGVGDMRQQLVAVAADGIRFFQKMIPMMMMKWSNAHAKGTDPMGPGDAPLRAIRMLNEYFQAEIASGRLRQVEPEVLARTFLAGLSNYAFIEAILKRQGQTPLVSADAYVESFIDVLWNGAAPKETA